jgi:hypothetical protein
MRHFLLYENHALFSSSSDVVAGDFITTVTGPHLLLFRSDPNGRVVQTFHSESPS